jgi:hypothetical protein
MLTKDEVEKLWKWVDYNYRKSQNGNTIESISDYIERGLIECELYEREPTAKEKYSSIAQRIFEEQHSVDYFDVRKLIALADAAILEAENARR